MGERNIFNVSDNGSTSNESYEVVHKNIDHPFNLDVLNGSDREVTQGKIELDNKNDECEIHRLVRESNVIKGSMFGNHYIQLDVQW